MSPELIKTADGSHTLYVKSLDEHYHSTFGAVQESRHVFINAGLLTCNKSPLVIFEVGLGTGLNAWLTLLETLKTCQTVNYIAIEKYPLSEEIFSTLNFPYHLGEDPAMFLKIHSSPWNKPVQLTPHFTLHKINQDLNNLDFNALPFLNIVYFDAFSPDKQPGLWDESIFRKLYDRSAVQGRLVTYCSKGSVRRSLNNAGYTTERIPGPPGKREMLRAIKPGP